MNESQLNQIYLRGYLHNNINNITDGLFKATKGNYGFFATGHVARKQFWKISGYKCKYEIMEIPIHSTINTVAFPMSLTSPYRKAINLGLIKMTESGVHDYITSLISPALPKCDQQTLYQSARLNDLITSFGLLGLGILAAVTAVSLECFWKKRKLVLDKLKGKTMIDHNFEFVH
ncbi:unnamed protein product [Ceutorhynchus assimilis]|uniref:Uncharacterized protein n=1 Tax=Ceutorhynchus assimilis TaxID=467358 RepID=A0A9N9MU98_9CUCU|nr:unnamed protein product [Ceutorhynchus assimilis]